MDFVVASSFEVRSALPWLNGSFVNLAFEIGSRLDSFDNDGLDDLKLYYQWFGDFFCGWVNIGMSLTGPF